MATLLHAQQQHGTSRVVVTTMVALLQRAVASVSSFFLGGCH
jgi:hypothetical protein